MLEFLYVYEYNSNERVFLYNDSAQYGFKLLLLH